MINESDKGQDQRGPGERRRRVRYSGTHPRRFEERYKERQPDRYPQMQEHVRAQGRTPAGTHVPVLLREVMEFLRPQPGEVVVDCTLGYGGHAAEFLERIGSAGRLIGLDVDGAELERTRVRFEAQNFRLSVRRMNFAQVAQALKSERLEACDVIFADLGVSSMQLDESARGFSYKHDGPLDMRMDDRLRRTAADLLARIAPDELAAALRELSDEPDAERIAERIASERRKRRIARTLELVELVRAAKGMSSKEARPEGELHAAARTFQALRILVNDEVANLNRLLLSAPYCLKPGGRLGVLTFHSVEDRLVKHAFRDGLRGGVFEAVAEEPIRPSAEEIRNNSRSSPAKFRWARRTR
ncbi:MAG: 16S rRNA (cytosine(1402)-N(4))-methyltransferase RsmH [Candidatus Brocadiia bacterium]